MEYLSEYKSEFITFPTIFLGLSRKSVDFILDYAKYLSERIIIEYNYDEKVFPLLRPYNCMFGQGGESYVFVFSSTMAVKDACSLLSTSNIIDSEELLLSLFEKDAFKILNGEIECYLVLPQKVISSSVYLYEVLADLDKQERLDKIQDELEIGNNALGMIHFAVEEMVHRFYRKEIQVQYNPIFKARNLSVDQKMCFCLLPFDADRLELFQDVIRPRIEEEFNFTVIRADNLFTHTSIMEDIWTYICKSRIVIADISKRNPNVFYELGICHTIGKDVIIICDKDSYEADYQGKFPFDIAGLRVITYVNRGAGVSKLTEDLIKTIRSIVTGEIVID